MEEIIIKGARENNLKNISLTLPKNKFIVMTGVSGSGKSSLAFDTIYKEGERRYLESLSAYARQFLGRAEKPNVDSIEGLSPAISIDQKTTNKNPRSTVGTVTEIYDHLRLLFSKAGTPYCPEHHIPIKSQSIEEMTNKVLELEEKTKIIISSPVAEGKKGTHKDLLEELRKSGYVRVNIDGNEYDLMTMVISTLADYPELGCLYSKVSYYYMGNSNGNRITRILIKSPYESSELKEITLDYVNRLKSFINVPLKDSSMSTMEKMLYVHDKIVVQADYIDDGTPYSHIASNILMKGQGVCQSYAGIFNNAMSMLGIDCIYVMSDSHAWNAVRIDGLWYYVDVTWDDPVGVSDRSYTSHQYFLVKKNEFSHSHELENSSNNIYGRILNNMGGAYDNCLVKQTSAKPFWYINGLWYYVSYDKVYTWDGIDDKSQLFRGISPASNVNLVAGDMKLYYSDNEGLHVYDVESGSKEKLSSGQYNDMYIDEDVIICRSISGDVFKYDMEAPAEPTREPGASTETPVEPTKEPGEATEAPGSADPTKKPADPTKEPTEAPGEATEAPGSVDPTKEPTEAPGEATETPSSAEPTMTPLPSLVTPANTPARPVNIMPADKLTSPTMVSATALQDTRQTLEKPLIKISRKKTGGKKKIIIKLKKYEGKRNLYKIELW